MYIAHCTDPSYKKLSYTLHMFFGVFIYNFLFKPVFPDSVLNSDMQIPKRRIGRGGGERLKID